MTNIHKDANFGGAGGIIEMFLQSQNGEIKLLPAVPTAMGSGTIKGIRARGGYTIDLTWSNNQLTSAVVTATITGAKTMNVRLQNGTKLVSLSLTNGQSRTITPADFGGTSAGTTTTVQTTSTKPVATSTTTSTASGATQSAYGQW